MCLYLFSNFTIVTLSYKKGGFPRCVTPPPSTEHPPFPLQIAPLVHTFVVAMCVRSAHIVAPNFSFGPLNHHLFELFLSKKSF